jgi:hypothetical protein
MKFSVGGLFKKLSSKCEFCENQLCDTHGFLKGVNRLLPELPILHNQFM